MYNEHYLKKRSLKNIGTEVGCDHSTVAYYLSINHLSVIFHKENLGHKRQNHPQWRGHGEISSRFWNNIKNGATQREIPFNITIQQAWDLYLKQDKKCVLTGREIGFENARNNSASLDRIDSKLGYELSNIQWVHKDVNFAKQSLNNQDFLKLCEEVVNKMKGNKTI